MPSQGAARAPRDAARCSPGGQRLCDRPNRRTTVGRVSGAPHREPLVGRGRELEVARQLLQAAVDGRPQLLTLSGEVGIGKSRLARAIAAEASRHGALTLWGAGQEDLSLPYLPVSMALAPLSVDGPGLLDPGSQGAGADADPVRMWGNVTQAVLAAASQRPVVLVMDDLQWTDGASQALLLHLLVVLDHAATSAPVRLLTVITVRTPHDEERTTRMLSRVAREPNAVALELGGLARAEVRDLLAIVGPAPPSTTLVQRVVESSSGNPLFAQSILRRGLDEGRLTVVSGALVVEADDPLPVSADELDRSVIDRLSLVDEPCRHLLTIAAFLGDQHPIAEIAELADLPVAMAEQLVDDAVEAGLLRDLGGRCAFSHPQIRHVLFHAPRRRARQRLHLHLADRLEARGDVLDELAIAHHLARAGDLVEAPRLAHWSALAARRALALGAWADAGIAAEQALTAMPPDARWDDQADLHILITEAASHDFDLQMATQHGTAAVTLAQQHGDATRWGRALLPLARTLVTNGGSRAEVPDTTPLIQDYLHRNPDAAPMIRAQLLSLLSEMWGSADRTEDSLEAATAARDLLPSDADPGVASAVHVAEGMARWARLDLREARDAYERAVRASTDATESRPGTYAAVRLNLVNHLAGDVERAADETSALLTPLADTQMWGEHALAAAAAATTAVARGEFEAVERLTVVSERSVSRSGYLWPREVALPAVALARTLRGDGNGAREAIDTAVPGAGTAARYHLAIDALLGDTERVAEAVRARPWRPPPTTATLQTLPVIVLHAEVAAAIGDGPMAAGALVPLRSAHERGVLLSQGWASLLSRLITDCHLANDDIEGATEWLEIANHEARARGLVVEAARLALSEARLARVDPSATEALLRGHAARASQALDALGALPLAAAARRLGRLDTDTAGPARRAILFTDLVGSTALNVRAGDSSFLELLREHNEVVRACLRRHAGVEFKHTGDGIAAWFTAPADAVDCAIAIGNGLERASAQHPDLPLRVRTGISVGEPLGNEGDLFGLSVVHAARLCALAGDGEVLVSNEVVEAAQSDERVFRPRGLHQLKGFPAPVEVHTVVIGAPGWPAR